MNRCKRSHLICQILFTNNSLLFNVIINVAHFCCRLQLPVVSYNFVLDTVTLSNLLPLRNYVVYCTSTDHLLNNYGAHDYGDISGAPQNKMKNKYCSTHSAEHIAGTVMRVDKKYWVWIKIKHKIKRKKGKGSSIWFLPFQSHFVCIEALSFILIVDTHYSIAMGSK